MSTKTILLVDDDPVVCAALKQQMNRGGYDVSVASTAESGLAVARDGSADLVLLDIGIPEMGGEALLQRLRIEKPQIPVVVLTTSRDIDLSVRCIKAGAADFLSKPCPEPRLLTTVKNVLRLRTLEERLREAQTGIGVEDGFGPIYGRSPVMRRVFDQMRLLSQSDISVLVTGASGTGKELVARALHGESPRRDGPFLALNCGAIPETMLESELFGHEKGAFTGAYQMHRGCFEQADTGTLFLDEIGEMRPDMQVRLLRVLENREVRRLGGTRNVKFDVRVLAATNKDLRERVAAGTFREDLYFRIAVYTIHLPTLSERENDVIELAERFVIEFACRLRKNCSGLDREAVAFLKCYAWPGHVRELRNVIERAVLLAKGPQITPDDLPEELVNYNPNSIIGFQGAQGVKSAENASTILKSPEQILPMAEEERRIFLRALRLTNGDVTKAAEALGVGRATLYRRIKDLNGPAEESDLHHNLAVPQMK